MQIHDLNVYSGSLDTGAFLGIDNGTDTGKISYTNLMALVNGRIDNIIAGGDAPSAAEVTDARYGANGVTYNSLGDAIRGQANWLDGKISNLRLELTGSTYSHTFAGKENFDMDYPVTSGKPFYIKADVDNAGWVYIPGDTSTMLVVYTYYRKFTPTVSNSKIRFYSGSGSGYSGTINFTVLSEEEYMLRELTLKCTRQVITDATGLSNITGGTKSLDDFPKNTIMCVGASNIGLLNYPSYVTYNGQGVYITFDGQGYTEDGNGVGQLCIGHYGMATRWKDAGAWTSWQNNLLGYREYDTRSDWLTAFPSDKLEDIPVNKVVCIGSSSVAPSDAPRSGFNGNVITLAAKNKLDPGVVQLAFDMTRNIVYKRVYYFDANGNYWGAWSAGEEEYHVGTGQAYTSLTSLLLDLAGDIRKKVIYIHKGEYDMFAEYLAEVTAGRITIPSDDITAADYFEPYNAFVPNNTRIVGLGNVTLKMTPTVAQLEAMSGASDKTGYGASRTWSPLNIYGSVEIENLTVKGHNCRYCLHNDDHNNYPNSVQHYKNVRFLYEKSDNDSQERLLGFNTTIGFGIQDSSTHIFEDCEIYIDTNGNDPAYYGHDSGSAKNGKLILKNCRIHSNNFSNDRVVRLQTLATSQGKVNALFESCYVNGGLSLNMYYTNSPQNFDVDFVNCNKVPVARTIASGGTIVDPYTVKWYNPLPTPTAASPQIETDSYSG